MDKKKFAELRYLIAKNNITPENLEKAIEACKRADMTEEVKELEGWLKAWKQ